MKFFQWCKDGGPESRVWSFIVVEIKSLFSVMLLKFEDGTRDIFHEHAFNAVSWLFKGSLIEDAWNDGVFIHSPSLKPIITKRKRFHQVTSVGTSWALTFRGPWNHIWVEGDPWMNIYTYLTHGRKVVHS